MKIHSVEYDNSNQEWGFKKIDFFDLTLLVGVSGVGKTQILRSIHGLKQIAGGTSENGVSWEIDFTTLSGRQFVWKGKFENIKTENDILPDFIEDEKDRIKPKIVFEQIIGSGEILVDRSLDKFIFNGKDMPRLNSSQSVINLLKEEELIKEIYENFKLIILRDHTQKEGLRFRGLSIEKLSRKFDSFEKIKESDLDTFVRLALTYSVDRKKFEEITERFLEVFPQVEEVKVEPFKSDEFSNFIFEATIIQIRETGVNKWIPHSRMSSGMLRTLLHIAEMYLWKEGTVILIDEFENSLGLNCINVLTEDLLYINNHVQFIATSHHPYIINKIPYDSWKIVTRKGSNITTFDAKEINLAASNHDRFLTLINHPYYKGIF